MAESYFTTLTNTGKAMFANSPVLGKSVSFSTLAVGDGNGSYVGLDLAAMLQRTTLINEVWRGSINHISVHETNSNWLVLEAFIPSDVGDFDIREVGLFDPDGNLIAIGKYPLTYKPKITQGASKDLYVKMILEVSDSAAVELKVDPAVVLATRQHVADELEAYPEMVRKDEDGNVTISGQGCMGSKHILTEVGDIVVLPFEATEAQLVDRRLMECNGASVSRTTYSNLFAAIGLMYGTVDDSHFNLPDFRGVFLRGWDNGAGIDPDSAARTNRGDGKTGAVLGTQQMDQNKSHVHGNKGGYSNASGYANFNLLYVGGENERGSNDSTLPDGGNEARPKNISVMYCIRY